jgi:hypothetical protein
MCIWCAMPQLSFIPARSGPPRARRAGRPDRIMRLCIEGAGSPELPLRVLGLLAQQDAIVEHAVLELKDGDYRMQLETIPLPAERGALILAKIRAMVLVSAAELIV